MSYKCNFSAAKCNKLSSSFTTSVRYSNSNTPADQIPLPISHSLFPTFVINNTYIHFSTRDNVFPLTWASHYFRETTLDLEMLIFIPAASHSAVKSLIVCQSGWYSAKRIIKKTPAWPPEFIKVVFPLRNNIPNTLEHLLNRPCLWDCFLLLRCQRVFEAILQLKPRCFEIFPLQLLLLQPFCLSYASWLNQQSMIVCEHGRPYHWCLPLRLKTWT